jgi:hypothetical protein
VPGGLEAAAGTDASIDERWPDIGQRLASW